MTPIALLTGELPFYRPRQGSKRFLTPDSFSGCRVGSAPLCWRHWSEDSYTFTHPASWIAGSDGLFVIMRLDLTQEPEAKAYALAKSGAAFLSFGLGATPEATRAAVARWERLGAKVQPEEPSPKPYGKAHIEHMSLGPAAAFPQKPLSVVVEI